MKILILKKIIIFYLTSITELSNFRDVLELLKDQNATLENFLADKLTNSEKKKKEILLFLF